MSILRTVVVGFVRFELLDFYNNTVLVVFKTEDYISLWFLYSFDNETKKTSQVNNFVEHISV